MRHFTQSIDTQRLIAAISISVGVLLLPGLCLANAEQHDRFTIEDSISLERPVDLCSTPVCAESYGIFSPDDKLFVVLTRSGDIKTNTVVDTARVYSTESSNGRNSRSPNFLFSFKFRSTDNHPGIKALRWSEHGDLIFIAPDERGVRQVHLASISGDAVTAITAHDSDVVDYAQSGNTLLFFARVSAPQDNMLADRGVFAVNDEILASVIDPTSSSTRDHWPLLRLYVQKKGESVVRPIPDSLVALDLRTTQIWLSPSGNYAVVAYPPELAPPSWKEYVTSLVDQETGVEFGAQDRTSAVLPVRRQYMLVDTRLGTIESLLDAPNGTGVSSTRVEGTAFWSANEGSVIVPHTYLPLENTSVAERNQRIRHTALVEVELSNKSVHPIMYEPLHTRKETLDEKGQESIRYIHFDAERNIVVVEKTIEGMEDAERRFFVKEAGEWRLMSEEEAANLPIVNLGIPAEIIKREDARTPPVLYIKNPIDGSETPVFEPFLPFAHKLVPQHEEFHWKDGNGTEWVGSILTPPDYDPRIRYPLIVQSHGYNANEFLIDGPDRVSSSFAAQALVHRGFIVLQIREAIEAITVDENEGAAVLAGLEAAIQDLSDRRLIDPERVGAIGWSRTGFHMLYASVHAPDLFKAVVIADSATYGYAEYLAIVNFKEDMLKFWRAMNGSTRPTGDGLDAWITHAPAFNMDSVEAPIRLESYGLVSLLSMWELYAILRDQQKPVDLLHFPDAPHALVKPDERHVSQKGTIQWLLYWIEGIEDPDPVYKMQYERWEQMRDHNESRKQHMTP